MSGMTREQAEQLVAAFGLDRGNTTLVDLAKFVGDNVIMDTHLSLMSLPTKGYSVSTLRGDACQVQLFLDRDRAVAIAARDHGVVDTLIARPK